MNMLFMDLKSKIPSYTIILPLKSSFMITEVPVPNPEAEVRVPHPSGACKN